MNRQAVALRELIRRWVVVALVAAGVTLGLLALVTPHATRAQTPPGGALRSLPDFADLAERVGPSVVNIRTVLKPSAAGLHARPVAGGSGAVGSGFVLTADGYLLTNAHVVADAAEVSVTLSDGRQFAATVVGFDSPTDVAVIKIDAAGLPAVKIGRSSRLRAGQWVIAIGSAFGLDNSVTAGIVSAKERQMDALLPFIQTDVAINLGNSGGPLIDMNGEVVGVNSDLLSEEAAYAGVSLSIPIEEAMLVADQLRAGGRISRGQLGVSLNRIGADLAKALGLGPAAGVEVRGVIPGGPADSGGIEAGDIITAFDGKATGGVLDLRRRIVASKPGAHVSVQVFRRGKYRSVDIVVGELVSEAAPSASRDTGGQKRGAASGMLAFGLAAVDLTPDQKRRLGLRGGAGIAAASGAAAQAGLLPDDVVLQVGDAEVTDSRQFESLVGKADRSKPVILLVRRGPWTQYVLVGAPR